MAEKRVSVRLSAEGGRAVRAEMEGIGKSGEKGFGRLSKEAEVANRKLSAFARSAKLAASAAAGAVAAAAVTAGVAMVRSGLQTIDAQAKLAQSLGTTVASIQTLERAGDLAGVSMSGVEQATKDLTRRLSQAAAGSGPAAAALERLGLSATDLIALPLDQRVGAINAAIEAFVPVAERAAVAGQLFGEEGSIAMSRIDTATLRQATADVRDFGVATSEADAAQIQITNDAISRLGLVWRGLANQLTAAVAPSLEALANAMAAATRVGGTFQTSIAFLGRNLGEIASIAAPFAAFFAGRFVLAMGAAALGLRGVTLGLVAFKSALLRTGIGALIVGVGELAFRMNLFGEAADQSSAAQARMNEALGIYAQSGGPNARAEAIASTQAYIAEAEAKLADAEATLAQMRARQIAGQALLDQNPLTRGDTSEGSMGEAMARNVDLAAAAVVALQAELDAARTRLKALEEADLAAPLNTAIPAANGLTGALAQATRQSSALSTFLSGLPGALAGAQSKIAGLRAGMATLSGGGDAATAAIARYRAELVASLPPLATLQDGQRAFVRDGIEEKVRLFAQEQALTAEYQAQLAKLGEIAVASSNAGSAGLRAGNDLIAVTQEVATGWQAVTQALDDHARRAQNLGAEIGQSLVGAFDRAGDALADFVRNGTLDFRGLVTAMIADLAQLGARRFILGPISKALSGALSLFSGGDLFANIGGAAVMHAGGLVGGAAPLRAVPALAFAGAPRMHAGGFAGLRPSSGFAGLRPDEVPAILQRGERVLSRRETQGFGTGGNVTVNIQTRDAESFRQSRTQVAADIARAVSMGRRGL